MASDAPRRWLAWLAFLLAWSHVAWAFAAEPSASDKETARGLIDRGDTLSQKGDLPGALQAYRGAYAIVRVPTTGAAVARTLKVLGQLVEAKKVADEVVAMERREGEPGVLTRARDEAAQIAKDVAPRIATLKLIVRGVPQGASARVDLDGRELGSSEVSFGVPVDPGSHRLTATAGDARASAEVTLGEGEHKTVTLGFRTSGAPAAKRAAPATKPAKSSRRTIGWVVGGVGVLGLATAGVTGAMLLSRDSEIDDNCPDKRCNAKGRELIDGSGSLMLINGIAWGVGVVGLAAGGYLVLSGDSPGTETAAAPVLMPGGAGLSVVRGF